MNLNETAFLSVFRERRKTVITLSVVPQKKHCKTAILRTNKNDMITIAGFLRGINVGGHHKVPMAELRNRLNEIECRDVKTLLNSGNFVFKTDETNVQVLENKLEDYLSKAFGFPIPVILRAAQAITDLVNENPFKTTNAHKDTRLYVSFLKETPKSELLLPYALADKSLQIISVKNHAVASVLDLSTTKTPKGMEELEKIFGKNITTRNWNTVEKTAELCR